MIPRRTFASVLCAVLFGTFGQVAVSAADGSSGANLEMRVFKVDTHSFYAALKNVPGLQTNFVSANPINPISPKSVSSVLGVDLTAPGRSIAFKDTLGLLFVKATPSELDTVQRALDVLNKAAPQVHVKARFIKMSEADADAILKAGTAADTKEKNTVEIMTAAKATPLLRKLESRSGMTTLSEPEATTTSLRQIQMRSGNSTVDLNPALLADDLTINLTVTVSAPETLAAQANVWDGQTVILASNNPGADKTRLLVFITVTIVDLAGNRAHSDDDLLLTQQKIKSEIPPQHTLITTPSP